MIDLFLAVIFAPIHPEFPVPPLPVPIVCEMKNGHNPVWNVCGDTLVKHDNPNKK